MAVENDADRLAFLNSDDFAVEATITPNGGDPIIVSGIYDAPHLTRGVTQSNGYDHQAEVSGNKPQFRARSSDLAAVRAGRALVSIPGVGDFNVHDTKPDGTGMTVLQLMRA
jgi:hypothetical protein